MDTSITLKMLIENRTNQLINNPITPPHLFFFLNSLTVYPWLAANSLYRKTRLPQIYREPPASAFQVLTLKAHVYPKA